MSQSTAIIIGGGPAGLTAAVELVRRSPIKPIVLEATDCLGGIARTANYKGNRIDIGGHRFFSKSDRVMQWWLDLMPLEKIADPAVVVSYQRKDRRIEAAAEAPDPEQSDRVMLLRRRKSRIYFLRRFFDYPIQVNADTIKKLGLLRVARMGFSYLWAAAFPYKHPENLEQFFINRFGKQLYLTFFKSYTEKVWGQPCTQISAAWGDQRIKGLSITKALLHFLRSALGGRRGDVAQKCTETSLIEQFLYPKLGPGQMWEIAAQEVRRRGGEVLLGQQVTRLHVAEGRVTAVEARDARSGQTATYPGDWFFSTMPVKDLIAAMATDVPESVREVAAGLVYRDFITVGLLVRNLLIRDDRSGAPVRDNWIYIQEPDVQVGRLQIFNNWSPYLVADRSQTWIGLEYFCNEGDALWRKGDREMIDLGVEELARIGIIDRAAVLDGTVLRMPKTYPAYFGTYDRFDEIRAWTDRLANLFLIGRNGMHKYNNQDHSMLAAMVAVDNILAGRADKSNLWSVNTEQEYHEEK